VQFRRSTDINPEFDFRRNYVKLAFLVAVLAAFAAAPASAQTAPTPAAAEAKLSIDSSIEALAANPVTKAVLDANFPGMTTHPAYEQFKGMSLKVVQPFSGGAITDEAIAKTAEALAAIK
jgi:hypothetical protein